MYPIAAWSFRYIALHRSHPRAWLGLQNPLHQFDSGRRLDEKPQVGDRVRIEIAYHGQASAAAVAAELAVWRSDFWSGEPGVCPVSASALNPSNQHGAQGIH